MPETSVHTTVLLNTLWEFTRRKKDDKDSFIQKGLKVCPTFKVMSLKTPRLDVPAKKTAYNFLYKDMRETKEELKEQDKRSAIISME